MELHYIMHLVMLNEGGFRCVVILPKDTNTELEATIEKQGEGCIIIC